MRKAIILLVLLAACGETRTACVNRANADLRALDAAIAETELALARGYRVNAASRVTAGFAVCSENNNIDICLSTERPISERRVAITPSQERARLRALEARRPAVAAAAERAAAACPL